MKEPKNEITKMVDEGNMNLACELAGKAVRHCSNTTRLLAVQLTSGRSAKSSAE